MKTEEGLWKLSPSGLYGYEECPRCFWIEQHVGSQPGIPFTLNNAMDSKLKERYDQFRKKGKIPPEVASLKGIRLFEDLNTLDQWRRSPAALQYINEKEGYVLRGKLDEVFVNNKGELLPIDFKSSGDAPKEDKYKYYVSQLHAYALMFKNKGYKPAKVGYLVHYFTEDKKDPSLIMKFISHIDKVEIDLPAFEKKLKAIVALLERSLPKPSPACKNCGWYIKRDDFLS